MTRMPIPIKLDERRAYYSGGMSASAIGFKGLLGKYQDYVSHRVQRTYDFGGELGERDVEIVMFKSDDVVEKDDNLRKQNVKKEYFVSNRKQNNRAIFFTVNGQVHGDKGLSFIKNRCDKYHTGKDTVVMVDFSDLGPAQLTDLFTPARDRLQDKAMAKRLESGMEDLLTNDPMLVEQEQRRREKFTQNKRDEKMSDMLEQLIQQNDDLLDYLETGNKASTDKIGEGHSDEAEEYEAPFFPDTLTPIGQDGLWDNDERFEIEIPVNRDRYVSFFMNAPNNFFTRDDRPGNIIVKPQEIVRSHGITDGTWTMQLRPFEAATPGMTIPVSVDVGAEGMDPLSTKFNIQYIEPVEEDEKGSSSENEIPPLEQIDFPDIVPIYEDDWSEHPENWDENTPVRLAPGDPMTLWVNFDAAPVKNFMRRHKFRTTGKKTVEQTWRVGVAMYAVSTYIEVKDEFSSDMIQPDHVTEVSMRGIVQSMLDQQISDEELEALTV
jgi:ribosomal protein S15P/S13E